MKAIKSLVMLAALGLLVAPPAGAAAPKTDVLIVGGGLSGLSTAFYLKRAGLTYHVLELSPHLGGRMRSAKYPQGVEAEAGLAEFWESNPALGISHALHLEEDRPDVCFSSHYYKGKLVPFTQDTNDQFLASFLSPSELKAFRAWDVRMQANYHRIQKRPIPPDLAKLMNVSFADWMAKTSHISPRAQAFVRTTTEPEFATSWTRISALDGIAEWHIFSGKGTPSHHIKGGNQRLAEAIADDIGRDNVEVNRQVTNIKTDANGAHVEAMDGANYEWHHYDAKYVVTSIPLFRLFEIQFTPPLPAKVMEGINTQTWGAYFTAHVILKPEAKKYWTVGDDSVLPILTGGPLGVIYGGQTENKGHVMLNLLVTGDWAESYNARTGPLDAVTKTLTQELDKQWHGIGKDVEQMTFVRYHPRAIASWPVGRSRFDALSDEIRKPHGRLFLGGDFTEGTHSDGAVTSAERIVSQICKLEHKPAPAYLAPPSEPRGARVGM